MLLQRVLVSGDVSTVVLVKIILLQCVVDQLDPGHCVMHVDLCGQIRFVFFCVFFVFALKCMLTAAVGVIEMALLAYGVIELNSQLSII